MSGNSKDNMLYILGILFVIVPIAREIIGNRGKKFSAGYIVILVVLAGFLIYLGVEKNGRDNNEKGDLSHKVDSLIGKVSASDSVRRTENIKTTEFLDSLQIKFNITRDPKTNSPIFNIDKSKHLDIRDNHGKMEIKQ